LTFRFGLWGLGVKKRDSNKLATLRVRGKKVGWKGKSTRVRNLTFLRGPVGGTF